MIVPMTTFDAAPFVEATAPIVGLSLMPAEIAAVSVQLARIHALAQPVMDFSLTAEDEAAPRFEP